MRADPGPADPTLSGFLAMSLGLGVLLTAPVVLRFDPWLFAPVTVLGLAVVAAGVAALTQRRWAHGAKWALFTLAAIWAVGRWVHALSA